LVSLPYNTPWVRKVSVGRVVGYGYHATHGMRARRSNPRANIIYILVGHNKVRNALYFETIKTNNNVCCSQSDSFSAPLFFLSFYAALRYERVRKEVDYWTKKDVKYFHVVLSMSVTPQAPETEILRGCDEQKTVFQTKKTVALSQHFVKYFFFHVAGNYVPVVPPGNKFSRVFYDTGAEAAVIHIP